ncbi:mitochondrial carrier protein [Hirsutella rhossiliensis]|uniref:Mitochondrial carrier protein n=1 Tax=Hirsutella rhossiliensis TaxID=111463 RepID=A0A9P8N044_9HYPO|nr:mitochondrial carrier protein [Hirsutella rhossiliensis]KAH0963494.1 mitochondrial carrier protein [Hirsutella rhossiliensis]
MDVYVAGAVAAFTVDVIVYPLDTLKTRYQSQDYIKMYSSGSRHKPLAIGGLYQGLGIVVLATLPAAGLFFSTYEKAKHAFARRLPLPEALVHACASGLAEMASCLVLAPAEVVKQNAQMLRRGQAATTGAATYESSSLQAFRRLAGPGAAGRLFTGYTALVARNLPFTGLQFPVFEHLRSRLWELTRRGRRDQPDGLVETGLIAGGSAGAAGAVAAFLTTPSDVVKTRMMVTAGSDRGSGSAPRSKQGSWAVAKQIYCERGIKGFLRGASFRSGWTAIGSSLYLGSYDTAKLWLRRRKPELDDSAGL